MLYLWLVVGKNPGKDRILHQVIVCSPGQRVQVHQVLKVTDFPFLVDGQERHRRRLENKNSLKNNVKLIY